MRNRGRNINAMAQTEAGREDAETVVVARDIGLVYRGTTEPIEALRDLSLSVRRGEFVSILGPSGCGKTTFLKMLSGLLRPTTGELLLENTPIRGPRPDIGVVFQEPTLLPWKTVLDNVLLPAKIQGMDRRSSREKAHELLALTKLEEFANNYPFELSGGMQQRVSLARGLIHDPHVVLMDEPFGALDAMTRETMGLELQRIWMSTQKSVVFITHSIPEAVFLSDRVLVFSKRPARVVQDLKIRFPRPRGLETLADSEFSDLCNALRREFAEL